MSLIGTSLGRIRVVDTLGIGGMGEVYLGYDETLKRKVALKAIRDDQRFDAEAKARFLREARVLSQLDHPGICRIYELVEGEDSDFLVLELIEGTSLRKAMDGGLDGPLKLYVAEMVAEALAAAHAKGVAHRDLKPENVMLTTDGEVKVLDFGLAFPVDERLASSMKLESGAHPATTGTPAGDGKVPAEPTSPASTTTWPSSIGREASRPGPSRSTCGPWKSRKEPPARTARTSPSS